MRCRPRLRPRATGPSTDGPVVPLLPLLGGPASAPPDSLAPTTINFVWNNHTPPLPRFLTEISRATAPQVTWFDWGAAWTLPFTPALHYRRSILAAARWRLRARDLPGRAASLDEWAEQLHSWRRRLLLLDHPRPTVRGRYASW
ncbi:lantibiotic dehydratase [Streptomyces acidicola]|uniref:lantibiotic dehydratase n=1 Tax=Streptomyces acidicola TaxID=2596892 RepID=UPI003F4D729A